MAWSLYDEAPLTDRREKIAALLQSPVAGERDAARAALDRLPAEDVARPEYGTTEWHAAVQEWCRKLEFCISRLGSPILSKAEIVLTRNWGKGRGEPWAPGAEQMMAVYRKLMDAEATQDRATEALTDQAGISRVL